MNNEIFFKWNIPVENNYYGLPDDYINVVATRTQMTDDFFVLVHPVIVSNSTLKLVKKLGCGDKGNGGYCLRTSC